MMEGGGTRLRKMLVYVMSSWTGFGEGSRTAEGKEHGEMKSENTLKRKRKTVSGLDEDGYEYRLTKLHGVACYKTLALI
jgi:hypothetical protein